MANTKENKNKKNTKKKVTKKEVVKAESVSKEEVKKEVKVEEVKEDNILKNILLLLAIIIFIVVVLVKFPNTVIWNIVVLLLMLTVLIFVHEGGHFLLGKACGVHIYEFALGMGPKVLGFRRKNDPTEYTLRALPIGGYCQLAGEEGEDDESLPKDKFMCNKSKLQRVLILVAGVTMNFITAIILLFFISLIWGSTDQSSVIGYVEDGSPAYEAGIVVGDEIIELNGYKISTWDKISIVNALKHESDTMEYVVRHEDGKEETYKLTPVEYALVGDENIRITEDHTLDDIAKENNLAKEDIQVSKMIGIGTSGDIKYGFVNSLSYAFKKFGSIVEIMLLTIGSLFTGKLGLDSLSGPVGMYTVVNQVAAFGLANILYLMAYLSINLGIINILPFPAFDGGRVLFVGIEAVTGKKVDAKIEGMFHAVGFILLMILMLYITFQDILRLF